MGCGSSTAALPTEQINKQRREAALRLQEAEQHRADMDTMSTRESHRGPAPRTVWDLHRQEVEKMAVKQHKATTPRSQAASNYFGQNVYGGSTPGRRSVYNNSPKNIYQVSPKHLNNFYQPSPQNRGGRVAGAPSPKGNRRRSSLQMSPCNQAAASPLSDANLFQLQMYSPEPFQTQNVATTPEYIPTPAQPDPLKREERDTAAATSKKNISNVNTAPKKMSGSNFIQNSGKRGTGNLSMHSSSLQLSDDSDVPKTWRDEIMAEAVDFPRESAMKMGQGTPRRLNRAAARGVGGIGNGTPRRGTGVASVDRKSENGYWSRNLKWNAAGYSTPSRRIAAKMHDTAL